MLKLKCPSRVSKETFLVALGIAKIEGNVDDINKNSIVCNDFESCWTNENEIQPKLPKINVGKKLLQHDDNDIIEVTQHISSSSTFDRGTPVNSKMMAIESELEQDMAKIRDNLETKNIKLVELHLELAGMHDELKNTKSKHDECKTTLRLSEKRIE